MNYITIEKTNSRYDEDKKIFRGIVWVKGPVDTIRDIAETDNLEFLIKLLRKENPDVTNFKASKIEDCETTVEEVKFAKTPSVLAKRFNAIL